MIGKLLRAGIVVFVLFGSVLAMKNVMASSGASVSAVPSAQMVTPGANFVVDVSVTTSTPTLGIQFAVSWDPTKVKCTSVQEGTFYSSFVQQNSSMGMSEIDIPSSPTADNTAGKFPSSGTFEIGLLSTFNNVTQVNMGPTGTGNVYILNMTALSGASGTATFTLSSVGLADNGYPQADLNPTINDGQVTISNATSTPSPTITGFTPATGGSGTTVTINGTNFQNLTGVSFGGTAAQSYTANSGGTQITAVVGTGSTGNVTVANLGGSVNSTSSFTFVAAPTITSFSPAIGGQGKTVTIIGTNFTSSSVVKFGTAADGSGGVAASSVTVNSAGTSISAIVASGATGYVNIVTAGGAVTDTSTQFTFAQVPTISSFSPQTGSAGTAITITGTNFINGDDTVTIGGVAAGVTGYTNTQINATVSSGATSGNVSVTTPGGTATLSGFTVTTTSTTSTTTTTTTTSTTTTTTPTTTTTSTTTTPTTTATSTTTTPTTTTASTTMAITATTPSVTTLTTTTIPALIPSSSLATNSGQGTSAEVSGNITTLDLSQSMDTSGMLHADFLQGNVRYSGNNQIIDLGIKSGTKIVSGEDGSPVDSITIQPGTNVPAPPANRNIVSAVDFGPEGTIFSSPMTVVFGYDPTQVPNTTNPNNMSLECYNNVTNQWVNCDYTVDTQNHQITALISHFSLYAVMIPNTNGFMGVGWSLAAIIIIVVLVLGALVVYYFVRRTPRPAPQAAGALRPVNSVLTSNVSRSDAVAANESNSAQKITKVNWDDILPQNEVKSEPFKTRLEIVGGKIIISGGNKSSDIEIINNGESRVIISLDYDPVLHPRGVAKIITLGSASKNNEINE